MSSCRCRTRTVDKPNAMPSTTRVLHPEVKLHKTAVKSSLVSQCYCHSDLLAGKTVLCQCPLLMTLFRLVVLLIQQDLQVDIMIRTSDALHETVPQKDTHFAECTCRMRVHHPSHESATVLTWEHGRVQKLRLLCQLASNQLLSTYIARAGDLYA